MIEDVKAHVKIALVSLGLWIGIFGFVGVIYLSVNALAQTPQPTPPPKTCEQQLEDAQHQNVALRKQKAEMEFVAASTEEYALGLKKKLAEAEAKGGKAAAAAPTPPPEPPKK